MENIVVTSDELKQHNKREDCWIVVDRKVWNITNFLPSHPGGEATIVRVAGGDATLTYNANHAPGTLETNLEKNEMIGLMEESWTAERPIEKVKSQTSLSDQKPPMYSLINAYDYESVARKYHSAKVFAYYSSAAADLISLKSNRLVFDQITFVPRVLRNMRDVFTESKILGHKTASPFYIAPAATANQAHPLGEVCLAKGAGASGIIQCVSTAATRTPEDIIDAARPGQPLFFQLYVNRDRKRSEAVIRRVEKKGYKAIFLTVDTADRGKREAEERANLEIELKAGRDVFTSDSRRGGMARQMGSSTDPALCWDDIAWLKKLTKLPIVVKGIGSAMDARLAAKYGCQGIVVSNHGGRNLDTGHAPMITLLEMHKQCPEVFDKLEVYIDGGVRRGTDILKALCLGATAVGIGRPYIYSMLYGEEGVIHLTELLQEELVSAMRLTGCNNLSQVSPDLVNTSAIDHLVRSKANHPYVKWRPRQRL